ncbi:L-seryl-tRNA(Sec) selenium transferase [Siminovitchia sediminis]|uniref:L-seryl-tRNA(Sec) selenium transferase n=1 Tax=Siminovitchia sediminis TaxID=1274353 RepID=A0ABW4KIX0_9BACI
MTSYLRYLPSIHKLKAHRRFSEIAETAQVSEEVLTNWITEQVQEVRIQMVNDGLQMEDINREKLVDYIFLLLERKLRGNKENQLRPVINATGVVLHTNLGRARLSRQAIDQITEIALSYSTLEYNLKTGERGSRQSIIENYIKQLTGAEAAIVVNNNAAAVFLVLKALAFGKEVIVSRGELVEIGGSFRISSIMEESQAILVDVGTTNKTHLHDYENAITENTAMLLKVHKSNFKIFGFTEEVDTDELVRVSRYYHIPIYEDLGSGTLFDFQEKKIGAEPTVQDKVQAGIDIISFSGDKLLGGPQAGVIIGKKKYIDQLKKHQLARVLRVDKFTLAGLEATLKSYIRNQEQKEVPTIRDIVTPSETILKKANVFLQKLTSEDTTFICDIEKESSRVGGGTMPEVALETYVVHVKHDTLSSDEIARRLRNYTIPVVVRVKNDSVILDFRTVTEDELEKVVEAFLHIQPQ